MPFPPHFRSTSPTLRARRGREGRGGATGPAICIAAVRMVDASRNEQHSVHREVPMPLIKRRPVLGPNNLHRDCVGTWLINK